MKNKTTISIIMALLMVVSTLTVGTGAQEPPECGCGDIIVTATDEIFEFGEVTKEVWNGTEWVDYIEAEVDDVLHFRMTFTFYKTQHSCAFTCRNINVTDVLPNCLDYKNASPTPSDVSGKTIKWITPFTYEPLWNGDSFVINMNATVVACTEPNGEENFVEIDALEKCCNYTLYQNDTATIVVDCPVPPPECGEMTVSKTVYDGEEWVETYDGVEVGEDVLFNITITYEEGTCGDTLTDIVVLDDYHVFGTLSYVMDDDLSYAPSSHIGNTIVWNLTADHGVMLHDGESVSILIEVTPTAFEGDAEFKNCVTVTATENCCQEVCDFEECDCANFTMEDEPCVPEIEVIKKVWNGSAWAEYVDGLHIGDIVEFKIDIIWHACDETDILNMIVKDVLPYCLDYDETVVIEHDAEYYSEPDTTVVGGVIYWNWTYNSVILEDGDSITIKFNAIMARYCEQCEGTDFNCVNVTAAACDLIEPGRRYYGEDCAEVDCRPPESRFDKQARLENGWQDEEIHVHQGDIMEIGLGLLYYGQEDLNDIKFKDVMPCIIEYRNNLLVVLNGIDDVTEEFTFENSSDGKTLWFNSSGSINTTLVDGDFILLTFDVEVIDTTSECPECGCNAVNHGYVEGLLGCPGTPFFMEDDVTIFSGCPTCPPERPIVGGPEEGLTDQELTFTFETIDSDNEQVYYMINWGDGETSVWFGPYDSGVEISKTHTYTSADTYQIKAKAKDEQGNEGEWTAKPHNVVITDEPIPDEKELNVSLSAFSFGRIVFTVTNVGDVDMEDIDWVVNVTGGLLDRVNFEANCSIESLEVDEEVTEATGWPIGATSMPSGFGMVTVKVSLTDGDYAEDFEFEGFLIGKIFLDTTVYAQ